MLRERLRTIEGVHYNGNIPRGGDAVGSISTPPLPCSLGPSWGSGSGQGGETVLYTDREGSRPISPIGWVADSRARVGSANVANRAPPGAHTAILRPGQRYGVGAGVEDLVVSAEGVRSGGEVV